MYWLIPVGIAGAIAAWMLLRPSSASAGGVVIPPPGVTPPLSSNKSPDGPSGSDTEGRIIGVINKGIADANKYLSGEIIKTPSITTAPIPTQGMYYRIKQGETGSGIALMAYGPNRPYLSYLRYIQGDEGNIARLGLPDSAWFLPRWDSTGFVNTGKYTGAYARIFLKKAGA